MKKIFKFILLLLPWFISSIIFKVDTTFYKSLNLPFFAPPPIIFATLWPILYILITLSILKTNNKDLNYYKSLIINYISNQIYTFFFFTIKSPFIALVDTIIVLISSLFLYLNSNKSKLLIPYIIWNIFATVLSFTIYLMNL